MIAEGRRTISGVHGNAENSTASNGHEIVLSDRQRLEVAGARNAAVRRQRVVVPDELRFDTYHYQLLNSEALLRTRGSKCVNREACQR